LIFVQSDSDISAKLGKREKKEIPEKEEVPQKKSWRFVAERKAGGAGA